MIQKRDKQGRFASGSSTFVAAAVLALGVAAGGGLGIGAAGSTGTAGSSSVGSGSAARGSTNGTSARGKARDRSTVQTAARLVRQGLRVQEREVDASTDCAAHSYGQVQDFFLTHPCATMFRALLEVRDNGSAVALVAVAWVDMPDADQARQLQQLIDGNGTGNVTELSRERGRQRFSGEYYRRSVREDSTVINVQAEPVGRTRAAITLAQQATATTI